MELWTYDRLIVLRVINGRKVTDLMTLNVISLTLQWSSIVEMSSTISEVDFPSLVERHSGSCSSNKAFRPSSNTQNSSRHQYKILIVSTFNFNKAGRYDMVTTLQWSPIDHYAVFKVGSGHLDLVFDVLITSPHIKTSPGSIIPYFRGSPIEPLAS